MKMFFVSKTRGIRLESIAFVEASGPTLLVYFTGREQALTLTGDEADRLAAELAATGEGAQFAEGHTFNRDGKRRPPAGLARSGFADTDEEEA